MDSKGQASLSRRQFLTSSGAAAMLLPLASPSSTAEHRGPEASPDQAASGVILPAAKEAFLYPPFSARPMTRWWWFGGAATPEEITRELTMMRDAGLRGVELQPVYPLAADDPAQGVENVRYFTAKWFDLLRYTLQETKRLGLQFDFTLGSGWPYGGPFVPDGLAAHKLGVLAQITEGPGSFSWPLYPFLTGQGRVFAGVAAPLSERGVLDVTRSIVLPHPPSRWGGVLSWEVPPGRWAVMLFMDSMTGQQVKRPTIGMEGWVLDHFRREALDLFLDAVGNRTTGELQAIADPPFYSVFCDSLEVFGADWTPRFLEEFQQRRGYYLTPYLPALWQEAGPETAHVRYDYHQTLSDLMMDHFFGPLAEWSRSRKMTARVQAHGAMGDVMHGYGLADIPEGEEGEHADQYSVIIGHRRLASSAGHVYQKRVISCESYTWLRSPRYLVTLEMMKGATDSSFLDGINQIVNQGYSYSAPQQGAPGWVFYASTMVNHNNIWWPHYKYLAGYIQRAAAVLQTGVSVNPVAIYIPLADIYARYGAGSLTMDQEIERRLDPELLLHLRRAGYDFDLINDHALQQIATVENGALRAGTASYSAVIVPGAQFMPPESLNRLARFVQEGGLLVFMGRLPETAPGLHGQPSRTALLHGGLRAIWKNGNPAMGSVEIAGRGKAALVSNWPDLLQLVRAQLIPDFQIVAAGGASDQALNQAVENVGFLHRRHGDTDLYFLSNLSRHVQDLRVRFHAGHRVPERWNPESGSTEETLPFDYVTLPDAQLTEVQIHLDPWESCFIVFTSPGIPAVTSTDFFGRLEAKKVGASTLISGLAPHNGGYFVTDARRQKHSLSVNDLPPPVSIAGPWKLALGDQPAITLETLKSWSWLAGGKAFSGWGKYEAMINVSDPGSGIEWMLDLGDVHETAEVFLNSVNLGAAWKGLRRLSCRSALKAGVNRLEVKVGNLWIQKVESLPKPDLKQVAETFGIRWGTYGESKLPALPPSGLLGPVRLIPFRRISIEI
ncbi:MAG: hypothetical protein KGM47_09420 [Acidobacteriota bacterium]|nr:hypothetical protein [Acidobacteriota bacterium]